MRYLAISGEDSSTYLLVCDKSCFVHSKSVHVLLAQARPAMINHHTSIGNGFECNLGIIARATGKVIARAIASAIYACCECNYSQIVLIIYFKSLNTTLREQASTPRLKRASRTVSLLLAHDSGHKI